MVVGYGFLDFFFLLFFFFFAVFHEWYMTQGARWFHFVALKDILLKRTFF